MPEVTTAENCTSCSLPDIDCTCIQCPTCNNVTTTTCFTCDNCDNDCSCWSCGNCDRTYARQSGNTCDECNNCNGCCECVRCDSCNVRNVEIDGNCGYCENCCECREELVVFVSGPRTPRFNSASSFEDNKSRRFLSAELEVSDIDSSAATLADIITRWGGGIVHDGSISGNQAFEINTAPANGDAFLTQIKEVTKELSKIGAEANDSCGYHIHVDARDYNFFDLRKLIFLYDKIEDAIFNMVPNSRKNNNRYCGRAAKQYIKDLEKFAVPKDFNKKIVENVYGSNINVANVRGDKYHSARYKALNIHSWVYRGTIECRLFEGTVDYAEITNWAMLWAAIIDYAYGMSEKEIRSMKGDGLSILSLIAPNEKVRNWVIERSKTYSN